MKRDSNGSLTRGEFQTWQDEHQKYLDTKFGELHSQLVSHLGIVEDVKKTRRQDWKYHDGVHRELTDDIDETLEACKEACDEKIVCKQDTCQLAHTNLNKKLKYMWVSIAGLFIVLLISHPAAVAYVGKAIAGLLK